MLLHKSFAFVNFEIFFTALYLWWIYCSPSYNICYTSGVQLVAQQIVMHLRHIFKFYIYFTHTLNLRNNLGTYRPIHTQHAVPMPRPCRAHAVPLLCPLLIHTCHAAPLPCSVSSVTFVNVRVVAGKIRTASPTV